MLFTKIDGIDKCASRLVYGTTDAAFNGRFEEAYEQYELAYELGFRIFDTANAYGRGEETLGKWLAKSGRRDDVLILDKGCNPGEKDVEQVDIFSAETIKEQFERSLELLQTDHVEFYILHRDDPSIPVDEIVEILNKYHAEGKIKRFGGSNWTMERIKEANAYAEAHGLTGFSVCSPNYTYARLITDPWGGSVTLTGDDNKPFRDFLTENQMPVFNYSSLARGFLSGKYRSDNRKPIEECIRQAPIWEYYAPENVERLAKAEALAEKLGKTVPQIALAWLMHQPLNLFPLVAPTGEAHVREIVEALDIRFTEEELASL